MAISERLVYAEDVRLRGSSGSWPSENRRAAFDCVANWRAAILVLLKNGQWMVITELECLRPVFAWPLAFLRCCTSIEGRRIALRPLCLIVRHRPPVRQACPSERRP